MIYDHIEDKVYMDGDFKTSQISSSDIAYFTDGLEQVKFDLGLDGRIKGFVNNLKAKNLLVTGGQATYVKGDFNLKACPTGIIPSWNSTLNRLPPIKRTLIICTAILPARQRQST